MYVRHAHARAARSCYCCDVYAPMPALGVARADAECWHQPLAFSPFFPPRAGNKEFAELLMTASEITRAQMQQKTVVGMLMARCVRACVLLALWAPCATPLALGLAHRCMACTTTPG